MEASLAKLQQYFDNYNETKTEDYSQIGSDDTNVKEPYLIVLSPAPEIIEADDMGSVERSEHSETESSLSYTDELVGLLQKTKDISWQNIFQTKLKELSQVPDNWNGYGSAAPNLMAMGSCQTILDILHEKNFQPSSIYPSAEEGVTITFAFEQRRGILECYNDGDLISFVYQGDDPAEIREIGNSVSDLREEITRIEEFVRGR